MDGISRLSIDLLSRFCHLKGVFFFSFFDQPCRYNNQVSPNAGVSVSCQSQLTRAPRVAPLAVNIKRSKTNANHLMTLAMSKSCPRQLRPALSRPQSFDGKPSRAPRFQIPDLSQNKKRSFDEWTILRKRNAKKSEVSLTIQVSSKTSDNQSLLRITSSSELIATNLLLSL